MVAFTLTNHKEGFKKLLSLGEAIRFHCFNTGIFDAFWGRGPRCSDMLSHSPQITTCISYHHPLHSNSVPKKKKMSWKKWILSVHFSFFCAIFTQHIFKLQPLLFLPQLIFLEWENPLPFHSIKYSKMNNKVRECFTLWLRRSHCHVHGGRCNMV